MGQTEVFNFLKKYRGQYFSAKQISKMSGLNIGSVTDSLMRLRRWKEIKFKSKNPFLYSTK